MLLNLFRKPLKNSSIQLNETNLFIGDVDSKGMSPWASMKRWGSKFGNGTNMQNIGSASLNRELKTIHDGNTCIDVTRCHCRVRDPRGRSWISLGRGRRT